MAQDNRCRPGIKASSSTQFCGSYVKEKILEFSELFGNLEADCVVLRRRLQKKRAECKKAFSLKREQIRRDIAELQELLEEKATRLCQLRTQVRGLEEKYGEGKVDDFQEFQKDIEQCKRFCDSKSEEESDGPTTTQLESSSEDSLTSKTHQEESVGSSCNYEHIPTSPLFTENSETDQVNGVESKRTDVATTIATNLNGSPPVQNIISESQLLVPLNSEATAIQILDEPHMESVGKTPTDPVICGQQGAEATLPAPSQVGGPSNMNQGFSNDVRPLDDSLNMKSCPRLSLEPPLLDPQGSKESLVLGPHETFSRRANATQGASSTMKKRNVAHIRWNGEGNPPERSAVIDKVLAMGFVPSDLYAVIHPHRIPEYDISFVESQDLSRFCEAFEQHKYEATWLGFSAEPITRSQVCTVTILVRNESLPVNDLTVWLSRYGDLIGAPTKTLDERKIWTGGWKCQMRLKQINNVIQHIPRSAYLGRDRIMCFYNGQPKNCFKCGSDEHPSISCLVTKCSRCHTTGHATKTCNNIRCNLCSLLGHTYSRCPQAWHNTGATCVTPQQETNKQPTIIQGDRVAAVSCAQQQSHVAKECLQFSSEEV
ncbi:uncharacterized protein LOC101730707 [Xenopus tropicalis]|uniref:Uncharacterized LOC101730707 n=1 Tax=Xenopus tropicalis TaxID=8364 RepID=A0A6I8QVW1_XENTR|nr:uncharacterized protein LOC101730707 [Xenopus tropicalis]|eukprot:XP_004915563.1 PREDICTED: uncharacterized protein LOC101730707 [Xenopus tropicalis]